MDERKRFFIQRCAIFFGVDVSSEVTKLQSSSALSNFAEVPTCALLVAQKNDNGIHFENTMENASSGQPTVVFTKIHSSWSDPSQIEKDVVVVSLSNSSQDSLMRSYEILYKPIIENNGRFNGNSSASPELSGLELEVGFWKEKSQTELDSRFKSIYAKRAHLLEPLIKEIDSLDLIPVSEMDETVSALLGILDDVWKIGGLPFPQPRMEHILNLCGGRIVSSLQGKLRDKDLWNNNQAHTQQLFSEAIDICSCWIDESTRYTGTFWTSDGKFPWSGDPHKASLASKFKARIQEIVGIRLVVNHAAELLHGQDATSLLEIFREADCLRVDHGGEAQWRGLMGRFNENFAVQERQLADVLRELLSGPSEPQAVLEKFIHYKSLIQRPYIGKELFLQKEAFQSSLKTWASELKQKVKDQGHTTDLKEIPESVRHVSTIKQLASQVDVILEGMSAALVDFGQLEEEMKMLKMEMNEKQREAFDFWTRTTMEGINAKTLSLSSNSPVVSFDRNKLMRINYNPDLVTLVREVALFSGMGFKILPEIWSVTQTAQQFMRQAKALDQISNFHNTIGDRMLACLKPLVLDTALELSSMVQQQNAVKWTQTDKVNAYIDKLQNVVDRLSKQIQKLTQCHFQIREKVLKLFDTDLVKMQSKWKDTLREVRLIFATVEAQGFKNLTAWKQHWDHQLCKALDLQYRRGLRFLHQHLPEYRVDLDFKQQRLQFYPPVEEIRREFYSHIRKFISIPLHFKGFVDQKSEQSTFTSIVDNNSSLFQDVYTKADTIIGQLDSFKTQYNPWVAPALANLEQVIFSEIKTAEDWDNSLKAAKIKGQEIARLPWDDERMGNIVVSTAPLRRAIESIHRRFWDSLLDALQLSIMEDLGRIERHAQSGAQVLEKRAQNVEEFTETSAKFARILQAAPEMSSLMRDAEKKASVLSSWSKEKVDAFPKIQAQWESFNTLLSSHQEAIQRQLESLKSNILGEVDNLGGQAEKFQQRWLQVKPRDDMFVDGWTMDAATKYLALLKEKRLELNLLVEAKNKINSDLERFGEPAVEVALLTAMEEELARYERIWVPYEEFMTGLDKYGEEEWIVFRNKIHKLDEYLDDWNQRLEKQTEKQPLTIQLIKDVSSYKALIPALKLLRGETFSEKHWVEAMTVASISPAPIETILLRQLLEARDLLIARVSELRELNVKAAAEAVVRQALLELDQWEIETRWNLYQHTDSHGNRLVLVKEYKELLNKVGENLSLIQSVKDSTYHQAFGDRIMLWENKMTDLDLFLRQLSQIQRKWLYLEPVFTRVSLAKDGGRFRRLDADFRYIMSEIERNPKVTSLSTVPNLKSIIANLLEQIGRCQKSLREFLEEKRSKFPRFYFLGNDDLLDILGQAASKPAVIQTHLKKLFAGIHSAQFSSDTRQIVGVSSLEGETFTLAAPVTLSEDVEVWLNRLVDESRSTLQQLLKQCLRERQSGEQLSPLRYPAQILCLTEMIVFTERCERSITGAGLQKLLSDYKNQLNAYTSALQQDSQTQTVLHLKLRALTLDVIHFIDVIEQLLKERCRSVEEWVWQKQVRFYMKTGDVVVACVAASEIPYTYEYQGNAAKLVHTPLTDKCYLTLTMALTMGLGGNPYGPAGTGKTESVKALGSLLGRQVLVFNCDEGLDVKSMGRIFLGLAKCGAWGCFDEFNRLDESTLSTVSTLIQAIQSSIKDHKESATILGTEVNVSPHTGIFVTMNPAGKDYGGRQKLPDNLKQLFRPVIMSQPDNELIAEVLLYAQGFQTAKILGRKLVEIFRLAQKLLSRQQHYDWGLRALKSVLQTAGDVLRSNQDQGLNNESLLVVKALYFNTLSKLTTPDVLVFKGLVRDMFPDAKQQDLQGDNLVNLVRECYAEMRLFFLEKQAQKVLEVYEQLKQRMGVVIVGPPRTGKTTVWNILKHLLLKQNTVVKTYLINPKSVSRTELLGSIDHDTREWTDGILVKTARVVVEESLDVNSWVICDGDVDPEWIEALNSVLDDNRLLTLATGECIRFTHNVNFLFETCDLTSASPATISRMGVIYFNEDDIDVKANIENWISAQDTDLQQSLTSWTNELLYPAVRWVQDRSDFVSPTSMVATILGALTHLEQCKSRTQFLAGLVKGLATNMASGTQKAFAKDMFRLAKEDAPNAENPFLFSYDMKRDILTHMQPADVYYDNSTANSSDVYIPTENLHVAYHSIQPWLELGRHFMVTGPRACGKSLLLDHCFKNLRSVRVITIHCTAETRPVHVIKKLSQMSLIISNSSGRILRPRESSRLILFLRDINMVTPDKYGTCQLVAFLEQVMSHGGFYDDSGDWLSTENLQIVCSTCSDSSEGRFSLSPRFLSLVHLAVVPMENTQMEAFCTGYLIRLFSSSGADQPLSEPSVSLLTSLLVNLGAEMQKQFPSMAFTTRQVQQLAAGLSRYELSKKDATSLVKAFGYEAKRIYQDGLPTAELRKRCGTLIENAIQEEVPHVTLSNDNGTVYVTVESPKLKRLKELSWKDWVATVAKALHQYEREHEPLGVELLPELVENCARADRILSGEATSLLLPGRSGVGRHTLIKVVSVLHKAKVLSPVTGKSYALKNFNNDLKTAMHAAGVEGESVFFLLEDHHLSDDTFLSQMDSLLACGDVPGLFTPEEFDSISAPLKEFSSQDGVSESLYSFFCQRVKKNLHAVFLLDTANASFQTWFEKHPCLHKFSSCVQVNDWSTDSMTAVGAAVLRRRFTGGDQIPADVIEKTVDLFNCLDSAYKCPRRYVSLMDNFAAILARKQSEIAVKQKRIQLGVSKLDEARQTVNQLKAEAGTQEQMLAVKQSESNAVLQKITDTIQSASLKKGELEDLREKMIEENKKLSLRKKAIDAELAEIEPLLAEARAAVSDIRPEALSEIRSLRAPPDTIRDILEGVLRLMGILDTSWTSMKSFLAKRGVKEDIRAFDARKISPENRRSVETLLDNRKESFDPKNARRASAAAAPLAAWVQANVRFSRVLERIAPLEQEQSALQKNLQKAEDYMTRLSSGLDDVDEEVARLREQMAVSTREAMEIEINLKKARATLTDSQNLVSELEDEYLRWQQQLAELEAVAESNVICSLLAAAFVSYIPSVTEAARKQLSHRWFSILGVSGFSVKAFMSTEQELMLWRSEGLSTDETAVENAISLIQGDSLTPFILDSSGKSTLWLKAHFASCTVEATSQRSDSFATVLELALRFGKTLVVEDVYTIDPMLFPILRNEKSLQGTRQLVKLGEKLVDWNPDFRLFLLCRAAQCPLDPSAACVLSIVDFNTTAVSLSEQLLEVVVKYENPELEQRKVRLLHEEETLKGKLFALEDQLLQMLAAAQGNILENKDFLNSLKQTKSSSVTIANSLGESLSLQTKLDLERQKYSPLAEYGSKLYFALMELPSLHHCYQFSLQTFKRIFLKTLKDSKADTGISKGMEQSLLRNVYLSVSRGIFKNDLVAVGLHLLHRMDRRLIPDKEWEVFTREVSSASTSESNNGSSPHWLDKNLTSSVNTLEEHLPDFYHALQLTDSSWLNQRPAGIPDPVQKSLAPFQLVLATQALFPDQLPSVTRTFLCRALGTNDLFQGVTKISGELEDTLPNEPVLLLLPSSDAGSNDLSSELEQLASTTLGPGSYHELALGADQTDSAVSLVRAAAGNGHWVCLKNIHLVSSWLPSLERCLTQLSDRPDELHPNFRLWMTSEPVQSIPLTLLQRCKKIICQTPRGLKRNIQRSFDLLSSNIALQNVKSIQWQAAFVLAWCHAVFQERRHYVPQGWAKSYEFNNADLKVAGELLQFVLARDLDNCWDFLRGMYLDAVYGGRVEAQSDWQVLLVYLNQLFSNRTIGVHNTSVAKSISVPLTDNIREYWSLISRLPEEDHLASIGLPSNADNALQRSEGVALVSRLQGISISAETAQNFHLHELGAKIGPLLDLWKSLLQGTSLVPNKASAASIAASPSLTEPLAAFVQAEFAFAQRTVHLIHRTLSAVNRYVKASAPASSSVAQIAMDLALHTTPATWLRCWGGPEEPKEYLKLLVKKARALQDTWGKAVHTGSLFQVPLDLSELMSPEAFFGILRQHTARQLNVAMDSLTMNFAWNSNVASSVCAVQLHGLHIQGAVVTSRGLEPCHRDTPAWTSVPPCTVIWKENPPVPATMNRETALDIPVYEDATRTKMISVLNVPIEEGTSDDWYRAGIAFALSG